MYCRRRFIVVADNVGDRGPKEGKNRRNKREPEYLCICIDQMLLRVAGYQMHVLWHGARILENADRTWICIGDGITQVFCPTPCPTTRVARKMNDLIVMMKRYGKYLSILVLRFFSSKEDYRCKDLSYNIERFLLTNKTFFHSLHHRIVMDTKAYR